MLDFRLPKPFMQPREWSLLRSRSDGVLLLDLRLVHFSGGPLRSFAASLAKTGELALFLGHLSEADQAIIGDERLDPELEAPIHVSREADSWVLDVLRGRGHRVQTLSADLEKTTPTSFDWAAEVFPSARREFDEMSWRRFVADYVEQRGEDVRNLDDLRLLPSVMRRKITGELEQRLQADLAKALALFSPQDETKAPTDDHVMNNPTVHIVTGTVMTAFYRTGDELRERQLDWLEAAVIDELEESPRLSRPRLLARLEGKHVEEKLPRTRTFEETLHDLLKVGLVIGH